MLPVIHFIGLNKNSPNQMIGAAFVNKPTNFFCIYIQKICYFIPNMLSMRCYNGLFVNV
jgi:hypothetical protein